MRANSIVSIGNIGAEYPKHVRDIKALVDIIGMSNLRLKKKLEKIHNKNFKEGNIYYYKYLASESVGKICKANPDTVSNKIVKKLISKLKCKCKTTCTYDAWYRYRNSLAKTIGIIANKTDYALIMIKELLINSNLMN